MLSDILCSGCGLLSPSKLLCVRWWALCTVCNPESPLRGKRGWRDGGGRERSERGVFISFFFLCLDFSSKFSLSLTCRSTAVTTELRHAADIYKIRSTELFFFRGTKEFLCTRMYSLSYVIITTFFQLSFPLACYHFSLFSSV